MATILVIMPRMTPPVLPALQRELTDLGENIRLARLRRGFAASLVAERAGLSRSTLRALERGEATVSMGAYASVLQTLGLEKGLSSVAREDLLGRKLQDLNVSTKRRAPRSRSGS